MLEQMVRLNDVYRVLSCLLLCRVYGLSWKEDGISIRNLWTVSNDVTLIERY